MLNISSFRPSTKFNSPSYVLIFSHTCFILISISSNVLMFKSQSFVLHITELPVLACGLKVLIANEGTGLWKLTNHNLRKISKPNFFNIWQANKC